MGINWFRLSVFGMIVSEIPYYQFSDSHSDIVILLFILGNLIFAGGLYMTFGHLSRGMIRVVGGALWMAIALALFFTGEYIAFALLFSFQIISVIHFYSGVRTLSKSLSCAGLKLLKYAYLARLVVYGISPILMSFGISYRGNWLILLNCFSVLDFVIITGWVMMLISIEQRNRKKKKLCRTKK